MSIAVIRVDYDEGDLNSYRGMVVMLHGNEVFRSKVDDFLSRGLVTDMMSCVSYCIKEKLKIMWSSSVDHFQMERHEDYVSKLHASSRA